jgi:cell division protein FtsI/penicillin-binding protein 2
LRIEEDREEITDKNDIVINENEEDFEIRISKRMVRPKQQKEEEKDE